MIFKNWPSLQKFTVPMVGLLDELDAVQLVPVTVSVM